MLEIFEKWYRRYLFEEESVLLLVLLTVAVLLLVTIGDILTPVLAAIVLAYLMQGMASQLQRHGMPKSLGVAIAYLVFISVFFGVTLGLVPLVWRQLVSLFAEMPRMLDQLKTFLGVLPERYPEIVFGPADQRNRQYGSERAGERGPGHCDPLLRHYPQHLHRPYLHGPDSPAGVFLYEGPGTDSRLARRLPAGGAAPAAAHLGRDEHAVCKLRPGQGAGGHYRRLRELCSRLPGWG